MYLYIVSYLTKAKMSDFVYSGDHIKQAWLLAALIDILINQFNFWVLNSICNI